jgi:hypothetical protein
MPSRQKACSGVRGHTGRLLPSATVVGRSQVRLTGREARSAAGQSTQAPSCGTSQPCRTSGRTEAVALNPSPPVVSVDTIPLAPMAPVLPKTLTFVFLAC